MGRYVVVTIHSSGSPFQPHLLRVFHGRRVLRCNLWAGVPSGQSIISVTTKMKNGEKHKIEKHTYLFGARGMFGFPFPFLLFMILSSNLWVWSFFLISLFVFRPKKSTKNCHNEPQDHIDNFVDFFGRQEPPWQFSSTSCWSPQVFEEKTETSRLQLHWVEPYNNPGRHQPFHEVCVGSFCCTLPLILGQPNIFHNKTIYSTPLCPTKNDMNRSNGRKYTFQTKSTWSGDVYAKQRWLNGDELKYQPNIWVNLWCSRCCFVTKIKHQFQKNMRKSNVGISPPIVKTYFYISQKKSIKNHNPGNHRGFWHKHHKKQLDESIILSYILEGIFFKATLIAKPDARFGNIWK